MTRIFRMTAVAGMLVGLIVAPLGLAQAESHSGGANGASFEWTVPTVGTPKLEFELNGEKQSIGGDNAVGGVLKVAFKASDWLVSYTTIECPSNQIGKAVSMVGKTPSAALSVTYTPISGAAHSYAGTPLENRTPTSSFSLCV